jgi:hypothetical protein
MVMERGTYLQACMTILGLSHHHHHHRLHSTFERKLRRKDYTTIHQAYNRIFDDYLP